MIDKNIIRNELLFEMANIRREKTSLPYDIWVDEPGINRKPKHNSPRLKVSDGENEVSLSISEKPEVLAGNEAKLKNLRIVKDFISENLFAFKLQWEGIWDSGALITYCLYVGKKKMSKEEALKKLLDDEQIDEIPSL